MSAQGLLLRILPGQSTEAARIPSALVDAIAFAATFVFAGLHGAGLSRFAIYPVLAFHFFPWDSFRRAMKKRAGR